MANFVQDAVSGFKDGGAYDSHRPSYLPEVVDSLLGNIGIAGAAGAKVIDLAAGTGKFTEVLSARSEQFEVVAIEPVESMRTALVAKQLPRVKVVNGVATKMDMPDGWADALIVAQAFHWFANEEALTEIRRVLKPGGKLGVIWNIEDYNQPLNWTATSKWEDGVKTQIHNLADTGPPKFRDQKWHEVFDREAVSSNPMFATPINDERHPFTTYLGREALWSRLHTLSQVSLLTGSDKEAFISKFEANLADGDGDWNEEGEVAVHGSVYYAWTQRL